MTRLRTRDVAAVGAGLPEYDRYLESATGLSLAALASVAAGGAFGGTRLTPRFCVVPISSGAGIIPRFAETVRDILLHIGFPAAVSSEPDENGLAQARASGADVILWADDTRFVAELRDGARIDNTEATARGYVTGLDGMAGGLAGKRVLLLGCGPLGQAAAALLVARGARVTAFDIRPARARALAARAAVEVAPSLEEALSGHDLVFEATPAAGIIKARHVTPRTRVAAPGMPCGVTPAAKRRLSGRLLHDPLPIGVATMAFMACGRLGERRLAGHVNGLGHG